MLVHQHTSKYWDSRFFTHKLKPMCFYPSCGWTAAWSLGVQLQSNLLCPICKDGDIQFCVAITAMVVILTQPRQIPIKDLIPSSRSTPTIGRPIQIALTENFFLSFARFHCKRSTSQLSTSLLIIKQPFIPHTTTTLLFNDNNVLPGISQHSHIICSPYVSSEPILQHSDERCFTWSTILPCTYDVSPVGSTNHDAAPIRLPCPCLLRRHSHRHHANQEVSQAFIATRISLNSSRMSR